MISVLIRNKNEANSLVNALLSIKKQKFNLPYEIVIIDDASTDNSREIANEFGCKVVKLDKKFSYGYALNFGLKYCQYEIVLLLSSHNILLSSDFFENFMDYFKDSSIVGVRCTPVFNTNQILQSIKNDLIISKNNYVHEKDWQNLIVANCSAIRKSVAIQIPFNETIRSNEEKLWALDVMEKGYSLRSNVPCYFLYNRKNKYTVDIRDHISKYQVDGISPLKPSRFISVFFKSIPWILKIAWDRWFQRIHFYWELAKISRRFEKGKYN
ncbi:glycosyl transferase family 2 [Flavobacterium sp. 270]|uniref:glycosyltransferase family 2 protein n=1 Tax=Flavobacterium sp. 270 TaxID=2512114 RepID=UPI001066F870|nr:glycosyltransferase family 2 protein [Flavobacterium sp. 270]TDW47156.1 glycosyl transferase family 2 [Flavobacterium sp. 270]